MGNTDLNIVENAIAKLQSQSKLDIQENWHHALEFNPDQDLAITDLSNKTKVEVNENRYIIFPKGRQVRWLIQKITIPQSLRDYPLSGLILRLVLTWWAEDAQIFINGQLVQEGDLFDSSARVLITNNAIPGQEFLVAIRLVTPNHDIGALMRSHLIYEKDNSQSELAIDPGLFSNELNILSKYLKEFQSAKLATLATAVNQINWDLLSDKEKTDNHLADIRNQLLPLAEDIKQRKFNILGHAHLDMAWLWTTDEAYEVAQRTFKSVINLQQDYPELTFCHTSPALYQWIEENCPELFSAIQQSIQDNKWEPVGGMWIEPDVNLVSGESIIRQLLYGQKYLQEKFGKITKVAWLPDSFGFPWQFPQLLKQCGIEYFVTGKLHWNDTNKFPHDFFWWEAPDGTKLFTLMSPPNVAGVMDTNPITMTNYAVDWEQNTGLKDIFWLPGVGDHGGGPTRDMLNVASLWQKSPFFPEIEFTTATDYLDKIHQQSSIEQQDNSLELPIHNSELYLELHRGCYTTHAEQKRFNRYCEGLLYQAELFATLANVIYSLHDQEPTESWRSQIETAWKKVLFNQFHDILPGTSIPEVFVQANQEWQEAIDIGEAVLSQSLQAIASVINFLEPPEPYAKPIVVFNALNWSRSQIISIPIEQQNYQVYDLENNLIESQVSQNNQLQFLAQDIPSVGYRTYWLSNTREKLDFGNQESQLIDKDYILENQYLTVKVNTETGNLDSIYDKRNQQEILSDQGNKLQSFTDKGQYWDAWNIDPEYEQKALPAAILKLITWVENNKLQQIIRVIRIIGKSEFIQDYVLEQHSPILKISTTVDWQETHVLVKAAFPLVLESDYATYEIACGAIEKPTQPQTAEDKAKWENSALKWVDLTDEKQNYGVSLLNDCKQGYDIKPNQIRITLLRSPLWPDPNSDRGIHQFTYAIYPHRESWEQAKTVQKSYELNILPQVLQARQKNQKSFCPSLASFIDLSEGHLILMAVKYSENHQNSKNSDIVLRCYECQGKTASFNFKSNLDLEVVCEVNALEKDNLQEVNTVIDPWKIKSFKLNLSSK